MDEGRRGLVTSVTASIIVSIIAAILLTLKVNDIVVLLLINILLGNVLGFIMDIVFAKQFGTGRNPALGERFGLAIKALGSTAFLRYMTITAVDAIVVYFIYSLLKALAVNQGFMIERPVIRDSLIAIISTTITFFLYVNTLRFNWALIDL